MADLYIDNDVLWLKLTAAEKAESLRSDISVPTSQIDTIEVDGNIHKSADLIGIKVGTRFPGIIAVASITSPSQRVFAVVHHNTPRGLKIKLKSHNFDELLVGLENPEEVKTELEAGISGASAT
ncbi:MAG: hypothetical protein M1374_08550 [Firmicutes bacterium]|nr:hypothetical protein [Bacillota bacterium]